jgi:hypothetical protein
MVEVCLPVRGTDTWVVHIPYANTPSKPSVVQSIILWNVCAALDSPKWVNKYSNKPNGVIIAVFGMSSVATGICWYSNPWQDQFLKKLCNCVDHWKCLACLVKGTCLRLSLNLNGGNRHDPSFLGTMCKGEAHGDFDIQTMPADSNLLNLALAICNFSGSRQWDFAKWGVSASRPRCVK